MWRWPASSWTPGPTPTPRTGSATTPCSSPGRRGAWRCCGRFCAHPDLTRTNRFGGTALIPAADRGHVEDVREILKTGINVNHVNNLGWTALLEAVILGDGGPRHTGIVRLLLAAGADPGIADWDGVTPLEHAKRRGYTEMVRLLTAGRRN